MTDKQIVQFILHRAEVNGQMLQLHSPKLVVFQHSANRPLFLGIRYENSKDVFFVRFLNGDQRGLFKITVDESTITKLREEVKQKGEVEYDVDTFPASVKHFVSWAVIEALKTKGIGFDLSAISFGTDPELIDPNETYEEAAIETDLLSFPEWQ